MLPMEVTFSKSMAGLVAISGHLLPDLRLAVRLFISRQVAEGTHLVPSYDLDDRVSRFRVVVEAAQRARLATR